MNTVKYFIGIVPPKDIYQKVQDIQRQFGDNRLEPHITIRPPLTLKYPEAWVEVVEGVCRNSSPMRVVLPATGKFGRRVLFIQVQSSRLEDLYDAITKAIKPFEPEEPVRQQNKGYTAHLTLGRSWCGFSPQDFTAMQQLADTYLSVQPVSFDADFVRIYHKPSHQARYTTFKDIPLGN